MLWFMIGLFAIVGIFVVVNGERTKRHAKEAYETSLAALKSDPANSDLLEKVLELSRIHSSLMRNNKGQTGFDDVALMNDIDAVCAATPTFAHAPAPFSTGRSIEERLNTLRALRNAELIDDVDFRRRKLEIIEHI
jgi:hypothetical protein